MASSHEADMIKFSFKIELNLNSLEYSNRKNVRIRHTVFRD